MPILSKVHEAFCYFQCRHTSHSDDVIGITQPLILRPAMRLYFFTIRFPVCDAECRPLMVETAIHGLSHTIGMVTQRRRLSHSRLLKMDG